MRTLPFPQPATEDAQTVSDADPVYGYFLERSIKQLGGIREPLSVSLEHAATEAQGPSGISGVPCRRKCGISHGIDAE